MKAEDKRLLLVEVKHCITTKKGKGSSIVSRGNSAVCFKLTTAVHCINR